MPCLLLLLLLSACAQPSPADAVRGPHTSSTVDTAPPTPVDADADGYAEAEDCDDAAAGVHPGAAEVCDGVDDDCDGLTDDADPDVTGQASGYTDADGDGYGDASAWILACGPEFALVADATDCDDGDASVWPGAPEACDGVDDDCDDLADEACTGAPRGELWDEDAQARIDAPCLGYTFPGAMGSGDVDGDGHVDIVAPAACDGANGAIVRELLLSGPFSPAATAGWDGGVLVKDAREGAEDSYLSTFDLRVLSPGDGPSLALKIEHNDNGTSVAFFRHPVLGQTTDDADVTLNWEAPASAPWAIPSDYWVTMVPGSTGAILYTGAWLVDDAECGFDAWVVDADRSGTYTTPELVSIGDVGKTGYTSEGYCDIERPHVIGDLDGDGEHDVLYGLGQRYTLVLGPIVEARAPFAADFVHDDDVDGGAPPDTRGCDEFAFSADLDGDGRDEPYFDCSGWDGEGWHGGSYFAMRMTDASGPRFDSSPLVYWTEDAFTGDAAVGDFDGDGWPDLAVGNDKDESSLDSGGVVYVEYGPFDAPRELGPESGARIWGTWERGQFGIDLVAGDTNGDGYDDLAIRGRQNEDDLPASLYVFLGGP